MPVVPSPCCLGGQHWRPPGTILGDERDQHLGSLDMDAGDHPGRLRGRPSKQKRTWLESRVKCRPGMEHLYNFIVLL